MNITPLNKWGELLKKYSTNHQDYWLVRYVFLRIIGLVYVMGFLVVITQAVPLIGENGLLPATNLLDQMDQAFYSKVDAFKQLPSIFIFHFSDSFLLTIGWIGLLLSLLVLIGYANVPIMAILWFLYMSVVHIGQLFYGYGWEIQLLETGFLAIFLVPLLDPRPFPKHPPPPPIIWLLRWLTFRINLGAGLIKIRGDECWRKLTCLMYHYETQPIPGPLSSIFHAMPKVMHKISNAGAHFIQLIAPWFVFGPRPARLVAGGLLIIFQGILMLSGNLSFLNLITMAAIIGCFDDRFLKQLLPKRITQKAEQQAKIAVLTKQSMIISLAFVMVVIILSVPVVTNLLSERQAMNTSFNQLHLVNTYGAFGSVGKIRHELIIQGTTDEVITPQTQWKEYEFKAKPGDVKRLHPIIAPYHLRIDWQIWFAAMSTAQREPWLLHFVYKLLHNDKLALSLIGENPFPDKPPTFIKIDFYKYELNPPLSDDTWKRTYVSEWMPPISLQTPGLEELPKRLRGN